MSWSTDPAWVRKQTGEPVTPSTVFLITWTSETESGTAGPFAGPDEASREVQNLLRADFRRVITVSPHEADQ